MEIIHVVAIITAKKGLRGKVLEEFHQNAPNVHKERGCVEYTATVDTHDAGALQTKFGDSTFVVVEKWKSLGALKDHAVSPHMVSYGERTKNLIENRVIHVLSPCSES